MSAGDAEALDRYAERGMELAFHAERHAERTALLDGDEALSFSALNGLANRVARLLRATESRRATRWRWSRPIAASSWPCTGAAIASARA